MGYGPAHGHLPVAKKNQALRQLVEAIWATANVDKDTVDRTFTKILRAGAGNVSALRDLIAEEAPPGCANMLKKQKAQMLPENTFFR